MKSKKQIRKRRISSRPKSGLRANGSSKNTGSAVRHQPALSSTASDFSTENLLQLQQTIGNRAASHLVLAKAIEKTALCGQAAGDELMSRYGSQSNAVKMLQHYLVQAGADIEVDSIFGPITHQAVVAFQKSNGLNVDDIAGPQPPG